MLSMIIKYERSFRKILIFNSSHILVNNNNNSKSIMNKEDKLHEIARDIMAKLNEKYNITNELSLDEYLDEFRGMLIEDEIDEILECLRKFDKL